MLVVRSDSSKVELPDFLIEDLAESNKDDIIYIEAELYRILSTVKDFRTFLLGLKRDYCIIYNMGAKVDDETYRRVGKDINLENFDIQKFLW